MEKPRVIVVMGVAGSGKSTIGALLASRNGGRFYDADDFHSLANIHKMAAGMPLDDTDRLPWLRRLRTEVIDATPQDGLSVLACSALKRDYRQLLGVGTSGVVLVYLKANAVSLAERLNLRSGHFMNPNLLASQFAVLEEPISREGLTVQTESTVAEIVTSIETMLHLRGISRGRFPE